MLEHVIHGPLLNPQPNGAVTYLPDGALKCDGTGRIDYVGEWSALQPTIKGASVPVRRSDGIILPPFLDLHTHIPQHPIRGGFLAGVDSSAGESALMEALKRNVYPAELRCDDPAEAKQIIKGFYNDTLAHGVVGGAAYMTTHAAATRLALDALPSTWSVGLVMMNINCPPELCTDGTNFESDVQSLAEEFGPRFIVTDRFAPAVDSALRQRGAHLAKELSLRMQTHLNEQRSEKELVEKTLYPGHDCYTSVYLRDGLLFNRAILAHCVWMDDREYDMLRANNASIAHCPTSNMVLGSGIMSLDKVHEHGIPYAIATDVGASPTTSMLAEMVQFLKVQAGRSKFATPQQALFHATLSPARILRLDHELGSFEIGKSMSYIEVKGVAAGTSVDEVILSGLLQMTHRDIDRGHRDEDYEAALNQLQKKGLEIGPKLQMLSDDVYRVAAKLEKKVLSVTVAGRPLWRREQK